MRSRSSSCAELLRLQLTHNEPTQAHNLRSLASTSVNEHLPEAACQTGEAPLQHTTSTTHTHKTPHIAELHDAPVVHVLAEEAVADALRVRKKRAVQQARTLGVGGRGGGAGQAGAGGGDGRQQRLHLGRKVVVGNITSVWGDEVFGSRVGRGGRLAGSGRRLAGQSREEWRVQHVCGGPTATHPPG